MLLKFALIFIVFSINFQIISTLFHLGRRQSVGVTGKLLCNSSPAAGVLLKLYDDDGLLGFDDLLAKGYTDQNGHFAIYGSTHEVSKIDPKLNIYHDCNDFLPCQRKISISVPDGAVYEGSRPLGLFSVGVLELGNDYGGESRDCFHR